MRTQNDRLLGYLLRHPEGITPRVAAVELGIWRLAARIYELRARGHLIRTTNMRKGRTVHARYKLTPAKGK